MFVVLRHFVTHTKSAIVSPQVFLDDMKLRGPKKKTLRLTGKIMSMYGGLEVRYGAFQTLAQREG